MSSTEAPQPLRVLVIGAGSAGLLMGQIFKKAEIDVTVFEQDSSPMARPRDWNFGVYWAQSRIEECLTPELNALIDTVQTDPSYRRHEQSVLPLYHGLTGEPLKEFPAPYAIRLARRRWLDLIRTGLDVRYGKRLQSISTTDAGVAATFNDGTTETGTLVIGAEGAHSVTRAWLFQSNPQDAFLQNVPVSSFVTITKLSRETALEVRGIHPTYAMALCPNGVFTWVSVQDCTSQDPADWIFMVIVTWNYDKSDDHAQLAKDSEFLLDKIRTLVEPVVHPFGTLIRDIPSDVKTWYSSRMTYWPTKPWDSRGGRVTLAGDAAHAMTFHRGQGLGNAITDVAELQTHIRAMKAHTREELTGAVAKYEKEVWQRGYNVVMENTENTLALHNWEKLSQSPLFVAGVGREMEASRQSG